MALTNKKIWQLCQTLKFWNRRITKLYGLSYWISDPIISFQDNERYIRPILYGRYERSHRYFRSLTKNKMRQLKLNDFQTGKSIYDEYHSKIPFGFKLIMIAGSRCQSWYLRRLCNQGQLPGLTVVDRFNNTLPIGTLLDVSNMDEITGLGYKPIPNNVPTCDGTLSVVSSYVNNYIAYIRQLEIASGENLKSHIDNFFSRSYKQARTSTVYCRMYTF